MLPDTFDLRQELGLLSDDAVAYETRDFLVANATAGTISDAYKLARINDEIREAVFGPQYKTNGNGNGKNGKPKYSDDTLDELNEVIAEVTRPFGGVFWLLEDTGLTICTTRVKRKAVISGGATVVVTKNGRFVTDNDDVALQFRLQPEFARATKAAERAMYMAMEDVRRIPALASKLPPVITATGKSISDQLALPISGSGNGNGNSGS